MPWVLWDIMVPLLVTFFIGLAIGWLLWRWRRQKAGPNTVGVSQADSGSAISDSTQTAGGSTNVVLIAERDNALARAEQAEQEVDSLKSEIERSVMGSGFDDDNSTSALADNSANDEQNSPTTADLSTQLESVTALLEKEKNSKAETELALVDLNSRYKKLSATLDGAFSSDDASKLKEMGDLKAKYENSLQQIAEQKEEITRLKSDESTGSDSAVPALGDAQAEIAPGVAHNRQSSAAIENTGAGATRDDSNGVHRLSAYPIEPELDSVDDVEPQQNKESDIFQSEDLPSSARDDSMGNDSSYQDATPGAQTNQSQHGLDKQSANDPQSDKNEPAVIASDRVVPASVSARTETEAPIDSGIKNLHDEKKVTSIDAVRKKSAENSNASADAGASNAASSKPTASGYVPTGWSVPDKAPKKSDRDDLQEIKGVGPVLEKMLHKTGIYYFKQVALLDKKGVAELDGQLPQFSGRIKRDMWVQQAKTLHRAKYGSAASQNVAS